MMSVKKMIRIAGTVVLAVCMLTALLPAWNLQAAENALSEGVKAAENADIVDIQAAEIVESGKFKTSGATNVSWTLDSEGLLTISGSGKVPDLSNTYWYADWETRKDKIRKIILEDGIFEISLNAFKGTASLESVYIPGSVKTIGENAFDGCTNLRTLDISEGDEDLDINEYAFLNCKALTELTLPSNTKNVKSGAFVGTSIESVDLPDGIEEAGSGFGKSTTVHYHGTQCDFQKICRVNAWYGSNIIFEKGYGHEYDSGALVESDNADANGRIQYTCKNCGENYYYDYYKDDSGVKIINGINSCKGIHDIIFPSEIDGTPVTSIGSKAFDVGNTWYFDKDLYLPDSLTSLDEYAFYFCECYGKVILPGSLTEIPAYAFQYCTAKEVVLSEGLKTIGQYAFNGSAVESMMIPNSVELINEGAFTSPAISKVMFPTEKTIRAGKGIFAGCQNLKTLYIPENIRYIDSRQTLSPFLDITGLEDVTLEGFQDSSSPDYYRLGIGLLQDCSNLKVVRFTREIDHVYGAFINCDSISDIYYPGTEESWEKVFKDEESSGYAYLSATVHCIDSHEHSPGTPSEHTHTLTHYPNQAPTCVSDGHMEYWYCTGCGTAFYDAEGKNAAAGESELYLYADPDAHEWGEPGIENESPDGSYDIVTRCLLCGNEVDRYHVDGFIPVSEISLDPFQADMQVGETITITATVLPENADQSIHWYDYDSPYVKIEPDGLTCKVTALAEGSVSVYCGVDDPGYSTEGMCTITIGTDPVLPICDHVLEPIDEQPTSCTKSGVKAHYHCIFCGQDFEDIGCTSILNPEDLEIPMTEHNWVTTPGYPATCAEEGRTDGTSCSICGEVQITPDIIPATGNHTPGAPEKDNLQPDGSYDEVTRCTVCGEIIDSHHVDGFIPVSEISLDPFQADMKVGETITITATVLPENADQSIHWYDYDSPYVKIEPDGLTCKVTALAEGSASVYCRTDDPGYSTEGMCTITVEKAPDPVKPAVAVTGISLTKAANIGIARTLQLKPTITPANATNTNVTWKSSNTKVATVDSKGIVTGIARGTAKITATTADGKKTATCNVCL